MLKKLFTSIFFAAVTAAQAATFQYSFTFDSGTNVSGTFDGTRNGNLVTDLTNISLLVDGVKFPDDQIYGYSAFGWLGAVASFDGRENNIFFHGFDIGNEFNHSIIFTSVGALVDSFSLSSLTRLRNDRAVAYTQSYNLENWSLVEVSAVPLPGALALMLSGLGVMSATARGRKRKSATA